MRKSFHKENKRATLVLSKDLKSKKTLCEVFISTVPFHIKGLIRLENL